ncbi:hypothetical protein BLNAU_24865 [Blattamonas nauphoetae]|uniref:Uncharacterized protein n=1 Tax=Blattamonas nauphoetae TaxID=2049346 RepID=A0ABQ9WP43_9EUKA|nr:hypothetical protein BLNAU_24865 [Blattamonas nauphoetae]
MKDKPVIADRPLVQPKVMTRDVFDWSVLLLFLPFHALSIILRVNTAAGVILNATNPRWSSDTHSDYYMDGDNTIPTVSLSVTQLVERHLQASDLIPVIPVGSDPTKYLQYHFVSFISKILPILMGLLRCLDISLVMFHTYRDCDHMGILQDAVPIARILNIIAQTTAEEMEY